MALSRNQSSVRERVGVYDNIRITQSMGLVMNREIDLRMYLNRWTHAFVADVQNPKGTLKSLQFFDNHGKAIHKIYLKPQSNFDAYEQLVDDLRAEDQSSTMYVVVNGEKQESKLPGKTPRTNPNQAAQLKSQWAIIKRSTPVFSNAQEAGFIPSTSYASGRTESC